MKQHTPSESTAALAALAGQIDALSRTVSALDTLPTQVARHADLIAALAERLTSAPTPAGPTTDEVPEEPAEPELAVDWIACRDPQTAITTLTHLSAWVEQVWTVFTPLPTCWAWHPIVVTELVPVMAAWHHAQGEDAWPDGLCHWLDRWRPAAATRIEQTLAACQKTPGIHVTDGTRWTINPTIGDELAYWWATDRTTPAPGLAPAGGIR